MRAATATRVEDAQLTTERQEQWALLVVDFVREQLPLQGESSSSVEAGLRRQMNPRLESPMFKHWLKHRRL